MLNTETVKKDFPIFENYKKARGADFVYLDSGATTQTPKAVVDAMDAYYFNYRANSHRGGYDIGEEATNTYENARKIVADFIGADTDEIIFTSGASAGSNMLIYALEQGMELKAGDEVVTSVFEHHSSLLPLQELAKRKGLTLRNFGITEDGRFDYSNIESLINDRTKIVSVTLASNVTGEIIDVKKITEIAHKHGAIIIADGAQAVGHIPVNVRELGCDFLIFSGHKMLGPTGIGVLYGKKEIFNKLPTSSFGGGTVKDVTMDEAIYNDAPFRFEAGTPNIAGVIGLGEAIKYLNNLKIENIQKHSQELVKYAIEKLSVENGVKLICERDPSKNIGIVSFVVDGIHPHDVGEILNRDHVAVRGGHHCAVPLMKAIGAGAVSRASFYVYNTESDVDALVSGIKKTREVFSYSLISKK